MKDYAESAESVEQLLAHVLELYERGELLAAFEAGRRLGPITSWPGTEGRVLAGRVAGQLGARRVSAALFLRAFRADRESALAGYYYTSTMLARHGAFAALKILRSYELSSLADQGLAADWHGLAAQIYGELRDFDTAEAHLATAFDLTPSESYRWVERSTLFELEDQYAQALAAAQRGLEINPLSPAAISHNASLLTLLDRMPAALQLLRAKLQEVETPPLALQLAYLEHETGDYTSALATVERAERLAPVSDKELREHLAQRRCEAWFRLGDLERALQQARLSAHPQYKAFVERIESGEHGTGRTQLPVAFVRQHHMTCAPATLTAISRYWSRAAEHLEVAEEICYDGTPHTNERRWAVEHGFVAREFRVDWQSARALVDRGVPFTLTTVYPGFAHLQAVIGYDALRGTLVIRDPTRPAHGEFAEKPFFAWSAPNGPRGMLLVPVEEQHRIADVSLPEAELYDVLHEMLCALTAHRRDAAADLCERLAVMAPGERIALDARRSLAHYDANDVEALAIVEQMLQLYPEDVPLRLHKAGLISQLRPYAEYIDYLETQMHALKSDAMFQLRLAQALLIDAREHERAVRLLKRVLRAMPFSPEAFSTLAHFEWQRGAYSWATQLYRFACTLQSTDEAAAYAYLCAARQVREQDQALEYLRSRVRRLGQLSSAPLITLIRCLNELERTHAAMDELNAALACDPDDAALALFAAGALAAAADFERAWPLLAKAEGRSRRIDWLRTAVSVHRCAGDLPAALAVSRELVACTPLDLEAVAPFARLLEEVEGRSTVLEHLRGLVARFPHHAGLNHLLVQWLAEEPLLAREQAIGELLQIFPGSAGARRELATVLARQQRFEEAYVQLEHARAIAPASESYYACLGNIDALRGDHAAARSAYRAALAISVDLEPAMQRLLDVCGSHEERRAQLAYVYEQLKRQVTRGEGLLTFQEIARATYEPEELLAMLKEGLAARPDLWQAWVSVVRQLAFMNRLDEAQTLCNEIIERFALLPHVHLERAEIRRLRGDRAGEREGLREALRLSPGWPLASLRLADSFEADGCLTDSRAALEAAVRHAPTDAPLHGYLASVLWRQDERSLSIDHLMRALRFDPGYEWAWQNLKAQGSQTGEPALALTLARELSVSRPSDVRVWLALVLVASDAEERVQAAERAVRLAPSSTGVHRRRLQLLTELRRFDEAFAALVATPWGEDLPVELRAERARLFAAQGDLLAAIGVMHEILAEVPRYPEGWLRIAGWHAALGDSRSYVEAAEHLYQLTPNDPVALGCLVDAQRTHSESIDVRPWLRRALELSPSYVWAASTLFDIELNAGDLDAAAGALAQLQAHSSVPGTVGREIALLARRGDKRAACERFRGLIRVSGDDGGAIQAAGRALVGAGWKFDLQEALDIAIYDRGTHPEAGSLWVWVSAAVLGKRFSFPGQVLQNDAVGRTAAAAYLEYLASNRRRLRLRWFIRNHRAWLRAETQSWALTGYAMLQAGLARQVCAWMADWREREGLRPWMLFNLVAALQDGDRSQQANEVAIYAAGLARDHTTPCHCVWLAADAALAGRREEANKNLEQVARTSLDPEFRYLQHLARALLCLEAPAYSEPSGRVREALAEVESACAVMRDKPRQRAMRRYAERTLWRLASARTHRPVFAAMLWVWWWTTLT